MGTIVTSCEVCHMYPNINRASRAPADAWEECILQMLLLSHGIPV